MNNIIHVGHTLLFGKKISCNMAMGRVTDYSRNLCITLKAKQVVLEIVLFLINFLYMI